MGSGSDYSDIERFLNSPGGCEQLNMVRRSILGETIANVRFENNTRNVKTLLIMETGVDSTVWSPVMT